MEASAYTAVLEGLGRYDESERLYRRSLVVFEAAYGGEHVEIAATLHNLGSVLAATGRLSEAETCSGSRWIRRCAFSENRRRKWH